MFQTVNTKSRNQTQLSQFSSLCLMLFLPILITRPSRELRAARFHRLSESLSEDWTSSSVMADGCWYTPRLVMSQIFYIPLKTHTHTHKPLYNSVWGSVFVSFWQSVSLSSSHLWTHTHTHTHRLKILRYKIHSLVKYDCGKSLFAGSQAGIISSITGAAWTIILFLFKFSKNCSQCICRGDGVVNQHHTVNPESKKIWDAVFNVYKTRMTIIYSLGTINSLINCFFAQRQDI